MKRIYSLIASCALLVLAGCDFGGSSTAVGSGDCSVTGQNATIKATMQTWYLFDDQLRDSDPLAFDDIDLFLDDIVADVIPADRFTYVWSQQEEDEFQSASYAGWGFHFNLLPGNDVRLIQVYGEFPGELQTPASTAGLKRGLRITAIDGVSTDEIIANRPAGTDEISAISDAFGARDPGVTGQLDYVDPQGVTGSVTMTKEYIQFSTVALYDVFNRNGRITGYLNFRSFANPSFEELRQAFVAFNAQGVTNLVVDVRYNGGGLVSVAEYLGNLLLGRVEPGSLFFQEVFNSQNSGNDASTYFSTMTDSLPTLDRVVFITTGFSASASEMVLNGMIPWVETASVGSTSYGKPVGSYGFTFCDQVLRPVTFKVVNGVGTSDYFDGFTPTCEAADNPDYAFGDPMEDSLAAALTWVETGACPVAAGDTPALLSKQRQLQELTRGLNYKDVVQSYQ
ncbi:MAG: S41 family peptidase [Gammaproteobacteria bacterium]|nr:S41 family peptidase [Gammaproteobacteria bacterium]